MTQSTRSRAFVPIKALPNSMLLARYFGPTTRPTFSLCTRRRFSGTEQNAPFRAQSMVRLKRIQRVPVAAPFLALVSSFRRILSLKTLTGNGRTLGCARQARPGACQVTDAAGEAAPPCGRPETGRRRKGHGGCGNIVRAAHD